MRTPYEYRAQAREALQNRWGEGTIFVEPYMSTARAAFYEDLKAEKLIEETEEESSTAIE